VPRFGESDEREVAVEREAAQVAGAEGERHEAAGVEVDMAELAGAGIEQPQPVPVPARRVRHRQAGGDDLAAGDVDDDATVGAMVAPAVDDVGLADRGDVRRSAVLHRQSVEVAAILGREPAEERRAPERLEAVRLGERRQAAEEGVDEDQPAVGVDAMSWMSRSPVV
jgi:hypothetical protein